MQQFGTPYTAAASLGLFVRIDGANARKQDEGANTMGCDIHLFIEYKVPDCESWFNFGEQFRLDRDYRIFSKLAGVRSWGRDITPIAKPRGLPERIGYVTEQENRLYITDEPLPESREVSREQAEKWVSSGSSTFIGKYWVSHPDWHSRTWLTPDEFEECVQTFSDASIEYRAIVSVLRLYEKEGCEARVVFWFDN